MRKVRSLVPGVKTINMFDYLEDFVSSNGSIKDFSAFLSKPFSVRKFLEMVEETLRSDAV